ncbi:MAG: hypothetical protein WD342_11125 [Verrucomicrobiales bacterium]
MVFASAERFASASERYIDTEEGLEAFVTESRSPEVFRACAIDTEADSMHSYETKLCLIQFATPGHLVIIDPLAIGLAKLKLFTSFVDRFDVVWMHGGDYDISLFLKTFDWAPRLIFDTQIAARFLGVAKFGLGNLLGDEYGVAVSKQSQKADWSRRPISDKMLAYAYDDVRYLLDLGARYVEELKRLGRYDWFLESCEAARQSVMDRTEKPEEDAWKISGWGKLSRKGLHFLRTLWYWRDEECRRLDRPAFKFLNNNELFKMATQLESGGEVRPPHYLRSGAVSRLRKVIEKAKKVPPGDYPEKRRKGAGMRLNIDETHFAEIRAHRNRVAEDLGIEATLIATRGVLERLAATNVTSEEEGALMEWQKELLAPCLRT